MKNLHLSSAEAAALITGGATAVFAGSEDALRTLPRGNWIGGTSPYFMTETGGEVDPTGLFCTVLPEALEIRTVALTKAMLPDIAAHRFGNGFTYLLMPAFTEDHRTYAVDGPYYHGLCDQPVMGWVTGVHLSELGTRTPEVFDGVSGAIHDDAAVAMYIRLAANASVTLDIINLFAQGSGPEIVVQTSGFSATECTVDGKSVCLSDYITEAGVDTKLPLVANLAGANVNVSIKSVDAANHEVTFYAPVMAGESYRFAQPVTDYAGAYATGSAGAGNAGSMLACNCILNFLYADLEDKTTGGFVGPVTFGEIAYVLLNQTLVRLAITVDTATRSSVMMADAIGD
jgi:hypothetical protein